MSEQAEATTSFYERVGGHETFRRLVERFYQGVATDPLLRPLYPEADLTGAEERLRMFLEQYWGGPRTYSEQRGHPRLRMRHAPFAVTPEGAERWLAHMRVALDELDMEPEPAAQLWAYFEMAAASLVNSLDADPVTEAPTGTPEPPAGRDNLLA